MEEVMVSARHCLAFRKETPVRDLSDYFQNLKKITSNYFILFSRVLVKYNDLLIGTENNFDKKTILFPLCGKNVDMKWYVIAVIYNKIKRMHIL